MCIYIYGKIDQSFFLHFLCLWRAWLLCNREVSLQRNRNDVIEQDWILSSSFLLTKFFFFFFFWTILISKLFSLSFFLLFFYVNYHQCRFIGNTWFQLLQLLLLQLRHTVSVLSSFPFHLLRDFDLNVIHILWVLNWKSVFSSLWGKNRENGISISISISVSVSTSIWVVYSGK